MNPDNRISRVNKNELTERDVYQKNVLTAVFEYEGYSYMADSILHAFKNNNGEMDDVKVIAALSENTVNRAFELEQSKLAAAGGRNIENDRYFKAIGQFECLISGNQNLCIQYEHEISKTKSEWLTVVGAAACHQYTVIIGRDYLEIASNLKLVSFKMERPDKQMLQ